MGSFVQRSRELREKVGHNELVGHLNVDQIYAYCQHEHLWWNTRHKYLTKALMEGDYFGGIARSILSGGGRAAMIKAVEDLNKNMAANAPKLTGALAGSGGPSVIDDGAMVYNRAPAVARKPGSNRGIAPHRPPTGFGGDIMKKAANTATGRRRRA
jgi:hypothetical protein